MAKPGDDIREFINEHKGLLADNKVVEVYAEYSGSGDSGEFDEVYVMTGEDKSIDLNKIITRAEYDRFMDLLWDLTETVHGGFEINDGGGGDIHIYVDSGKIVHQGYDYVTTRSEDEPEEV